MLNFNTIIENAFNEKFEILKEIKFGLTCQTYLVKVKKILTILIFLSLSLISLSLFISFCLKNLFLTNKLFSLLFYYTYSKNVRITHFLHFVVFKYYI